MWEGHAWVLDGVDADGKFHMNWGFNGKFDGWYEIDAMSFHPYGDDEVWDFSQSSNSGNEMIINCFPYEGYVIPGGDEPELGDLNNDGNIDIVDVTILISYVLNADEVTDANRVGDINGDNLFDVTDVTAIIAMALAAESN